MASAATADSPLNAAFWAGIDVLKAAKRLSFMRPIGFIKLTLGVALIP
jgi:hypothetical protein